MIRTLMMNDDEEQPENHQLHHHHPRATTTGADPTPFGPASSLLQVVSDLQQQQHPWQEEHQGGWTDWAQPQRASSSMTDEHWCYYY
mmetsp:Transcript_18554/g.38324  ORF Transcript_18554/g.38324 Transcript_18554/m.38324 type:complete len:87 (-) Transcript_18554:982-1242(-)